ncbi:hypothetical protein SGPA1_21389 [Streptomyces misionensis JCM 4497]
MWSSLRPPSQSVVGPAGAGRGARGCEGFDLVGPEVVETAVPVVQFGRGVVVHGHREPHAAVHVVEHPGDRGGPPGQEHVLRVGAARPRPQQHRTAGAHGHRADQHGVRRGRHVLVAAFPPPHGARTGGMAGRLRRGRRARGGGGQVGCCGGVFGHRELCRDRRGQRADRAVEAFEDLAGHGVDPVEDVRGPRVGGAGLRLLLVGQQHRAQGQDLVDLRRVVQVTRALRRHLGTVRQDDRRRQQHRTRLPAAVTACRGGGRAAEDREGERVAALARMPGEPRGRIDQRGELHALAADQRVGGDQRVAQRLVPHRPGVGGLARVLGAHQQPVQPRRQRPHAHGGLGPHLPAPPQDPPRAREERLLLGPGGGGDRHGTVAVQQVGQRHGQFGLARHGLVEGEVGGAVVRPQGLHRTVPAAPVGGLHLLVLHLEVPHPHPYHRVLAQHPQQALGALVPGVRGAGDPRRHRSVALHPGPGQEHPELPADAVLGGGSAVRIEQVALVEHRVRDRAEPLEGRGPRRVGAVHEQGSAHADLVRHPASSSLVRPGPLRARPGGFLPPRSHRSRFLAPSAHPHWAGQATRGGENAAALRLRPGGPPPLPSAAVRRGDTRARLIARRGQVPITERLLGVPSDEKTVRIGAQDRGIVEQKGSGHVRKFRGPGRAWRHRKSRRSRTALAVGPGPGTQPAPHADHSAARTPGHLAGRRRRPAQPDRPRPRLRAAAPPAADGRLLGGDRRPAARRPARRRRRRPGRRPRRLPPGPGPGGRPRGPPRIPHPPRPAGPHAPRGTARPGAARRSGRRHALVPRCP